MTERDLITLFSKHGYVCVWTQGRYHAIKLEEVEGKQVKERAYSMLVVSEFVLDEIPIEPIEDLILRGQPCEING